MANVTNIEIRAQDKTTTAFRKVNAGLNKLDANLRATTAASGGLGLMNGGLAKMAGLMGGVIGIAAIKSFTSNLLIAGDRLQKVSLQLGITVEQLEIYQFAASQSGVGTEALNKSLQKFSRNIAEAGSGATIQVEAFAGLGVAIHDTNGDMKDSPTLFADVATAISNLQSPTEKIRLATDLFGKSGVELLPLLNTGALGIENFERVLRNANGIIGGEAADAMAEFNDKIDIIGFGLRGKLAPILVAILPALTVLVDNLDTIAAGVAVLAMAFAAAKLPVFITGIAMAIKGLTLAMLSNPFTAFAVAVTAIGTAIYLHGDTIAGWFGSAEPAAQNFKVLNKQIAKNAEIIADVNKVTKTRVKLAEKVAKTTTKAVIPSLKKLEEGMGKTKIQFTSLQGQEGLGGIQLAFRNFFMNVWADATFYLGGTSQTIKTNFSNMKQDFEEFFMALDNIVIFEGKEVRSAFSSVIADLESQINAITYEFNTTVEVPAKVFTFTEKSIIVPAGAFDTTAVTGSQEKLDSLVQQINDYSMSSGATTSRLARSSYVDGQLSGNMNQVPVWADDPDHDQSKLTFTGSNYLATHVPFVLGERNSSRGMSPNRSSPASVNASSGGGGNGVTVNIYDGTGQRISAYDSGIRVEITERASRNSQFAALV
tara:strand:- start:3497 stop:5455 length:1959 start_codon:yes stop_codon:yes gene_type:complete